MPSNKAHIDKYQRPESADVVIFGAGGDLTKRKLLPALAHMDSWNLLGPDSRIIGVVRDTHTHKNWKSYVHHALLTYAPEGVVRPDAWTRMAHMLDVVSGDLGDPELYQKLASTLNARQGARNVLFYLAIPPEWYGTVAENLAAAGLNDESDGFSRIVIEKPFGTDLASAQALNRSLQQYFNESQIYRIDHYLGKESVQNLMVFRFANSILEPLWNRNYIDHVQITVAESLGIEYRAGYYEKSGALRDMIQSHLMQVLTLVAMEPPPSLEADAVRDEKVQVLKSMRAFDIDKIEHLAARAQYAPGSISGQDVAGYREEENVAPDSATETFAAVKLYIDNWRWKGVPFLLRTGKRLPKRQSEIVIRFREPPQTLFHMSEQGQHNNELVFRLQPDECMYLTMTAKRPGLSMELRELELDAPYGLPGNTMPEAYETLLHDVLIGDAGLFSRADEVEESWEIVAPLLEAWQNNRDIAFYEAGSDDIPGMDQLMDDCEGGWRSLS